MGGGEQARWSTFLKVVEHDRVASEEEATVGVVEYVISCFEGGGRGGGVAVWWRFLETDLIFWGGRAYGTLLFYSLGLRDR